MATKQTIYKIRMVAALAELHHCVHKAGDTTGTTLGQELEIALKDSAIVLFLDVCQLHLKKTAQPY